MHLHGFDHHYAFAGLDGFAFGHEDPDDFAGHRGKDLLRALGTPGMGATGTQRTWIIDLARIAGAAYQHVEIAVQGPFALHLVGLAIVFNNGEDVARGRNGIDGERLSVHES